MRSPLQSAISGLPFLGLAVLVAIAFATDPDPRGYGTHEQLGFSPCGFREIFGGPCPTCGVTTSVSHVVHGNVAAGWQTQPLGVLIVLACLAAVPLVLVARRREVDLAALVLRHGARAWAFLALVVTACWLISR